MIRPLVERPWKVSQGHARCGQDGAGPGHHFYWLAGRRGPRWCRGFCIAHGHSTAGRDPARLCVALGAGVELRAGRPQRGASAGGCFFSVFVRFSYLGELGVPPMAIAISRSSAVTVALPLTRTDRFYTSVPFQTGPSAYFEGEDEDALRNILIGTSKSRI